jgi:hypothetical protein
MVRGQEHVVQRGRSNSTVQDGHTRAMDVEVVGILQPAGKQLNERQIIT